MVERLVGGGGGILRQPEHEMTHYYHTT
jgi:hypothetical protein